MSLGARLKELRMQKGESLQNLADAVEASKAHVWELETGRSRNPSLDLLERIARHFKVSLSFLVGEPGDAKVQVFGREVGEKLSERDVLMLRSLAERLVESSSGGTDGDRGPDGVARDRQPGAARAEDPRGQPGASSPRPRR